MMNAHDAHSAGAVALVFALLAGCDVKMEDGTVLSPGQRVAVTIMCPGSKPFDGWLKHPGNLTTAEGVSINGNRCVWMRRGSAHSGD